MPESPARKNIFAVASGSTGDARDDTEDGAKSVVDAVDGVADPCTGLLASLGTLGEEFVEDGLGIDFGRSGGGLVVATQEGA